MPETAHSQNDLIKNWNHIAGKKEFTSDLDTDTLFKFVDKSATILDYGCGYGRLLPKVTKKNDVKYVGFDPAEKMIEEARTRFPDDCFHNSFESLRQDTPEDGFDAILLISVLTAVPSNLQQKELLDNICALLKPQGLLIVNDFIVNRDQRNLDRYASAREKYNYPYGVFELEDGLLLRHHTEIYLHTLMEDCFDVLSFENGVFKTMNGNFSNAAKIVARKKD
jgi:2-polyprenyl-3-methyl-5-hydroxy-6-metoxy-1,4-benzoquinol methylase